eukprot:6528921-Lingulodinium_polyedra.AAC.1
MRCARCPMNLGSASNGLRNPARTHNRQLAVLARPARRNLAWGHCRLAKADRDAPLSAPPQLS